MHSHSQCVTASGAFDALGISVRSCRDSRFRDGGLAASTAAQTDSQLAAVAWRLLDYLGADSTVLSPQMDASMVEFAEQVCERLAALPAKPGQPSLVASAEAL
jgi:hypothetical protein